MRRWLPYAALILVLVTVFLLTGHRPGGALPFVSILPDPGQAPGAIVEPEPTMPVLRVGLGAVSSPRANLRNYADLLEYLGRELGRRVIVVQRNTYAEMNELIQAGKVDLAFICTFPYIKGQADFGLEMIAAPEVDGSAVYYARFIVPAGSTVSSLLDLRGGVYAFSDPLSLTGFIVPTYLLKQAGQTADKLFRNHIYTYSHDNSILAVADRLVDGAHINSLVYDAAVAHNPSLASRIRIVDSVGPFGSPPVVVRPDLDPELKAGIQGLLLGLDESAYGRELLRNIVVDRFVMPDERLYDEARRLVRQALGQ